MGIEFKYYKNTDKVFEEKDIICELCEKTSNYNYIWWFYWSESFENICVDCIKNWILKEYDCYLNEVCNIELDNKIKEEIEYRTPSIVSFQEQCWPSHCNDACTYYWIANYNDIELYTSEIGKELGLDSKEKFKDLLQWWYILKFKCEKCSKIIFKLDLD